MLSTKKGIVLALCLGLARVGAASAEPSYLIYPNAPAVFRYDVSRYELLGSDQVKFDPTYAIGNEMLWDRVENRIPYEIYAAPQLTGFEPTTGVSEFVVYRDDFDVIVDGFGTVPHTLGSLYLRFWPDPAQNTAIVSVDGVASDHLTVPLPSFDVVTQLPDGFYSDTATHHVSWTGATAMQIVVFSDKNNDGAYEGTPLYRIVARYTSVATQPATWGQVKALYR